MTALDYACTVLNALPAMLPKGPARELVADVNRVIGETKQFDRDVTPEEADALSEDLARLGSK